MLDLSGTCVNWLPLPRYQLLVLRFSLHLYELFLDAFCYYVSLNLISHLFLFVMVSVFHSHKLFFRYLKCVPLIYEINCITFFSAINFKNWCKQAHAFALIVQNVMNFQQTTDLIKFSYFDRMKIPNNLQNLSYKSIYLKCMCNSISKCIFMKKLHIGHKSTSNYSWSKNGSTVWKTHQTKSLVTYF